MGLFSIPAFFIVLREVLEACLVVGIALAYVNQTGATQYRRYIWAGAIVGVVISAAIGLAFGIVKWQKDTLLFQGDAEKIFEGVAFLIAAALLTWMIIWMMVMGKSMRSKLESRIDNIIEKEENSPRRRKFAMFTMVFVQVLREGIETVIFLLGTTGDEEDWRSIPIPGVLAIVVGLGASFLMFRGLVELDIMKFFYYSSLILIAFAAGLVSHAFHELQEVDWFGPWEVTNKRDWYNAVMWSTKACCHDKENQFFAMLRALFGYQDTPTFVEWSTYFAYWLIIAAVFVAINWSTVRAARSRFLSMSKLLSFWAFTFTFVGFIFAVLNVTWLGVTTMTFGLVLSIVTIWSTFDTTSLLVKPLAKIRKSLLLGTGIGWGALTAFMFVMHLVQMQCEGAEGSCSTENFFFFFGLVFDDDFNRQGRGEGKSPTSWHAIAVLSISIVLTVYFFGTLSFSLIMASLNVDSVGHYIHDDAIRAKMHDEDVPSAPSLGGEPESSAPVAV